MKNKLLKSQFNRLDKLNITIINGKVLKLTESIDSGYTVYDTFRNKNDYINDMDLVNKKSYTKLDSHDFIEEINNYKSVNCSEYLDEVSSYIQQIEEIDNYKLVFRRKIFSKVLNNERTIVLPKYEMKYKYTYKGEEVSLNYGLTGGLQIFNEKFDFRKLIDEYNSSFEIPLITYDVAQRMEVILGNELVGFLCHEAIGHMAEADFASNGSAFKHKLGKKILGENITVIDDGSLSMCGAGSIVVDDEGNLAEKTRIIENGMLNSYLMDKKYAEYYGMQSTGNARKSFWDQEPNIRMTNTYLETGREDVDRLYLTGQLF